MGRPTLNLSGPRAFVYILLVAVFHAPSDASHTFLTPGQSYLEYRPLWNNAKNQRVEFVFRTQRANTMLLHYAVPLGEGTAARSTVARSTAPEVDFAPELLVELFRGQLLVTFRYKDYKEEIDTAKGRTLSVL
jgi:hypothetical protein